MGIIIPPTYAWQLVIARLPSGLFPTRPRIVGTEMSPVQIDTSTAATDTIDYVATDQNGLTSTTTRTVIIQAANDNQASTTPTAANDNAPPLSATTNAATSTSQ
jgi:hypothetical protein